MFVHVSTLNAAGSLLRLKLEKHLAMLRDAA